MSALGDCTTYSAYVADLDGVAGAMTFSLLSKYLEARICSYWDSGNRLHVCGDALMVSI